MCDTTACHVSWVTHGCTLEKGSTTYEQWILWKQSKLSLTNIGGCEKGWLGTMMHCASPRAPTPRRLFFLHLQIPQPNRIIQPCSVLALDLNKGLRVHWTQFIHHDDAHRVHGTCELFCLLGPWAKIWISNILQMGWQGLKGREKKNMHKNAQTLWSTLVLCFPSTYSWISTRTWQYCLYSNFSLD